MTGSSPHVYDKAKYHSESIAEAGLPEFHASNHIVPMLRWLIENDLMSEFFLTEGEEPLSKYLAGRMSIHELFEWWDTCLIGDMLSERGNAFAMTYFDYQRGKYLQDYISILQGSLPTEFHVQYNEENYAKLKLAMDRRYSKWQAAPVRSWWQFWR